MSPSLPVRGHPHRINILAMLLALPAWLWACGDPPPTPPEPSFEESYAAFREARLSDLSDPQGWLSLAGLYWLKEGANPIGKAADKPLAFPKGPADLGTFHVDGRRVTYAPGPMPVTLATGDTVRAAMEMRSDAVDSTTVLTWGTLSWYVIERDGRLGLRLKDRENGVLLGFQGIETYPPDVTWQIEGHFEPNDPPRTIPVPNVLGTVTQEVSTGALVFDHAGQQYRLDAIHDGGEARYFILFADATSGKATYGGGRYLKVEPADANGRVVIDFNRAYNPPCVFTPYATCPLPTPNNRLPFAVTAGEKMYGKPGTS